VRQKNGRSISKLSSWLRTFFLDVAFLDPEGTRSFSRLKKSTGTHVSRTVIALYSCTPKTLPRSLDAATSLCHKWPHAPLCGQKDYKLSIYCFPSIFLLPIFRCSQNKVTSDSGLFAESI
jgi:hypothetical protein